MTAEPCKPLGWAFAPGTRAPFPLGQPFPNGLLESVHLPDDRCARVLLSSDSDTQFSGSGHFFSTARLSRTVFHLASHLEGNPVPARVES